MKRLIIYSLLIVYIFALPSFTSYTRAHEPLVTIRGVVSGYSSEERQTDDSPFITASNERVRDGIVANNCLDFGTEVEIRNKIYEVQDRMNSRYGCEHFDIWFADTDDAWDWGVQGALVIL